MLTILPVSQSGNGEGDRREAVVEGSMALRRDQRDYAKARRLRRKMSLPEVLLWRELKGGPMGVSFRKQYAISKYVIDFYCAAAKTGFEVDGIAHDMGDRPELDEVRTAFIAEQGIELVRIPAKDVLADPTAVAQAVVDLCRERSCPLHTRCAGGPLPVAAQRGGYRS